MTSVPTPIDDERTDIVELCESDSGVPDVGSYETEDGVVFYDTDNPLAWVESDRPLCLEEIA